MKKRKATWGDVIHLFLLIGETYLRVAITEVVFLIFERIPYSLGMPRISKTVTQKLEAAETAIKKWEDLNNQIKT